MCVVCVEEIRVRGVCRCGEGVWVQGAGYVLCVLVCREVLWVWGEICGWQDGYVCGEVVWVWGEL